MSKFAIDTSPRVDQHGRINFMVRSGGYVLARRTRCMPFILTEKEWAKLPKFDDQKDTHDNP